MKYWRGYHPFYNFFFNEIKKTDKELFNKEKLLMQHCTATVPLIHCRKKTCGILSVLSAARQKDQLKKIHGMVQQWTNPYFTSEFYNAYKNEQYIFPNPATTLNQALYNSVNTGMTQLLRYGDRNSMAHSREVRLPFLYHEFVEFLFTLPPTFKIHDGWTKYIQRVSFEKVLPQAITWRKDKIGYEPPQKQWMQKEEIKTAIRNIRQRLVDEKILHPDILKKEIQAEAANTGTNKSWNHLMVAHLFNTI
ncbi:MAG: hypothetical protein IPO68_11615 [Chitinophagaceae bacterium]|nr:hypothetical protein [Chitinophagaceae bacterium]